MTKGKDKMLTKQEVLDYMVKDYELKIEALEKELVQYALKHELRLELGDYGSGRTLVLEDDNECRKTRGDWLYSSESC